MNRFIKLFAALAVFLMLTGCTENAHPGERVAQTPYYDIYEENGTRYMHLDPETFPLDAVISDGCVVKTVSAMIDPEIYFCDLEEMKKDIETGHFTDEELHHIYRRCYVFGTGDPTVKIIDTAKLYEPLLPAEFQSKRESDECILWEISEGYSYAFETQELNASFSIGQKELYASCYDQEWTRYTQDTAVNVKITQEADRDATVLTVNDKKALRKLVKYEIEDEQKNLTVIEDYRLSAVVGYELSRISLYGIEDGQYFYVNLEPQYDLEATEPYEEKKAKYEFERPSVEWLSQFGLRRFEG